jgi:plasmid maintenance system antidote protein VapI
MNAPTATEPSLSETLRREIGHHPSLRSLAREADVDPAIVFRFRAGTRSISLETASKLARCLGVRVSTD